MKVAKVESANGAIAAARKILIVLRHRARLSSSSATSIANAGYKLQTMVCYGSDEAKIERRGERRSFSSSIAQIDERAPANMARAFS